MYKSFYLFIGFFVSCAFSMQDEKIKELHSKLSTLSREHPRELARYVRSIWEKKDKDIQAKQLFVSSDQQLTCLAEIDEAQLEALENHIVMGTASYDAKDTNNTSACIVITQNH